MLYIAIGAGIIMQTENNYFLCSFLGWQKYIYSRNWFYPSVDVSINALNNNELCSLNIFYNSLKFL